MMKSTHKVATFALVVLLVVTGYGLFRTREQADISARNGESHKGGKQAGTRVDQSTLSTARWLAQMPTTAEEREVAEAPSILGTKRWTWRLQRPFARRSSIRQH